MVAAPSRCDVAEIAELKTDKSVDAGVSANASAEAPNAVQEATPSISIDQRKIEEVMRMYPGNSDYEHTSTAQVLINMLPSLGEDGRIQATRHVCNLLSSQEINRVMDLWRNPGTSREVLAVLGSDLANRPYEVMLPAMLEAMKQPAQPDARRRQNPGCNSSSTRITATTLASWNSAAERTDQSRVE